MKGWFCKRALGPGPSLATGVTRVNGLPGQVMTAKKKVVVSASVAPTHGMRAACRSRCRQMARLAYPVSSRVQKRMLPSRSDHTETTEKNGGVVVALLRATYSTLKSWVSSEVTITPQARAARAKVA